MDGLSYMVYTGYGSGRYLPVAATHSRKDAEIVLERYPVGRIMYNRRIIVDKHPKENV